MTRLTADSRGMSPVRSLFIAPVIATGLLCLAAMSAQAAEQADGAPEPRPAKLFKLNGTLELTISAPWRELVRRKKIQTPYPATLTYRDESGQTIGLPLTVERRGLTRQRVCRFPPIKLVFDKTDVRGTAFRGQKSIKMVTHCNRGERAEQLYVKEMLIYRMYNLVTDYSFRVRPLRITYQDSQRESASGPHFAFLIEDDSDVAKRNDLDKLDMDEVTLEQLDPLETTRYMLFQYLISNIDFSPRSGPKANNCCHNSKLIGPEVEDDGSTCLPAHSIIPVPYDFDASGLVNAPYAVPNQSLPIRKVTQRLYRGYCIHNSMLPQVRGEFLQLESDFQQLIQNEPLLTDRTRKDAIGFIRPFFAIMQDPEAFSQHVTANCRK